VHQEFIPEGAIANKKRCKRVLTNSQEAICLKNPEILVAKDQVFLCMAMPRNISCCLCSNNSSSMVK